MLPVLRWSGGHYFAHLGVINLWLKQKRKNGGPLTNQRQLLWKGRVLIGWNKQEVGQLELTAMERESSDWLECTGGGLLTNQRQLLWNGRVLIGWKKLAVAR